MRHLLPAFVLVSALAGACDTPNGDPEWFLESCDLWSCGEPRPDRPCSDLCERPECAPTTVFGRDPVDDSCAPFTSACAVPEGWDYFYEHELCLAGQTMCLDSAQCGDHAVCDIRSCAVDAVGTCVRRPDACAEVSGEPEVLGCDGTLYASDCERLRSGAQLATDATITDHCDDEGAVWARDPRTGACSYHESSCDLPESWPFYYSREACEGPGCSPTPVWGRAPGSGECVEYAGDCLVPLGVEFFESREACESVAAGCVARADCATGQLCDLQGCGADSLGRCVTEPPECATSESVPPLVCGCDGVTYFNDCERLIAGVGLAHTGPCGAE